MKGVTLTSEELRKLLSCGCPDAVALYLYRKADNPLETALDALHYTVARMVAATDCLRQLGLWETKAAPVLQPERPVYSDSDLAEAMRSNRSKFSKLVGEAQRRLGRALSTEELKTLLSLTDYLRLPTDVIGVLLFYCVERNRRRDVRPPSMRSIEREAYRWADENIDTLETASFYAQTQLETHTRIQKLRLLLQIDNRRLNASEEQYLASWISMGFPDESIQLAFERTCLNVGSLKWSYMNSILKSWHGKNLHTKQEIELGDVPDANSKRRSTNGFQHHSDSLSAEEKAAVARALAEGQEG